MTPSVSFTFLAFHTLIKEVIKRTSSVKIVYFGGNRCLLYCLLSELLSLPICSVFHGRDGLISGTPMFHRPVTISLLQKIKEIN